MPLLFVSGAGVPLRRPSRTPVQTARRHPVCCATMAAESDHAKRAAAAAAAREAGTGPSVAFGSLPPAARLLATAAAAALAAAVGFVAVPPNTTRVAKPIAAGVLAGATVVGLKSLEKGKKKAASKALAKLLEQYPLDSPDLKRAVETLPARFGIDKAQAREAAASLYEFFMLELLQIPATRYAEMSDLINLKRALCLNGSAIGDAHFQVARAFYRNNVVFLEAEDDPQSRDAAQAKLDKLCFLSDRMYADKETDEAYTYEVSRICRFYQMDTAEFDQRVERVALPFYKEVVRRACKDPVVDALDVQAAQSALGIRDTPAATVRYDAYADTINELVTLKGKLDESDQGSLSRLRRLLGIADDRASNTLKTLAAPVFRADVAKALEAVTAGKDSFASIYGRLALRQSELGMPTEAARACIAAEASARAIDIVKRASKYLRVQNVSSCISVVKELVTFANSIVDLMSVAEENNKKDAAVEIVKTYFTGIQDALGKPEPRSMYRLYLSDILAHRVISVKEEEELRRLRALFGLTEIDAQETFKAAAGPLYSKGVSAALASNSFDDASKAEIVKIKTDLGLPAETVTSINLDLYSGRLASMVQGNRIIQEGEAQTLFVIRQFLDLSADDVALVHKKYCGPVYEQSVAEAMGATGIMLDEYRQGLERLRDRLVLSEDDANASFYRVVKRRMRLYVDRALQQLEKRSNLRGTNEERDVGDDPNIKRAGATLGIDAGGLPIELSNLVDFYTRNKLVVQEEIEVDGEKKTVTKYPVSLRGELQPKVYNELYKQYVIQCFSAQTRSEKQRLFASLDQLGPILGMTDDEVAAIHSSIGTVIYKNYLDQCLLKGPIGEKDLDFLGNIQKMLLMKEETCQKLQKDGKENRVSVLLERIFAQPKVLPETVKMVRDVAKTLEVDIVRDLKITKEQRKRLFGVEVDAGIDAGTITGDNQELIKEVQSSLQVPDDDAREVLLACIQRRTLSYLVQASASLRQNRNANAIAELRTMLRYGRLLPSRVIAPAVSDEEKQEMFLLFQADVITDGAMSDKAKESLNLLKILLGFSDADLEAYAA
jgi:hypothetical protein